MLEELCKSALRDACMDIANSFPLVSLRGYSKPVSPFAPFFGDGFFWDWNVLQIKKVGRPRAGSIPREAWKWFNENGDSIVGAYVRKRHNGNLEHAMIWFGTFDALYNDFKIYFEERKKAFMEKTENALQKRKSELAKKGEKPQSYGGVANLLKVLAKTSAEQGSSIQTIAKVQYAVCMQAGIFIPDEFLTDVYTAMDILKED